MKNLALRKMSGTTNGSRLREGEPAFFTTPAGWAFLLLASYIIWFLVSSPRPIQVMPDQDAYLEYFKFTDWDWLVSYFQHRGIGLSLIPRLMTDEIGWRLWIVLVNSLGFTPDGAIRFTVALANGLVFCALARLRRPLLGLLVWAVIPAALFCVGLFQVRQGFGFGVAMLIAIGLRRPILGMCIASTIHTTFAFPLALLIVARWSGQNNRVSIPAVVIAGAILAGSAQSLFDTFGGRRLADYANYVPEFSVNLLVLLISYAFASVLLIASLPYIRAIRLRAPLRELALMHLGLFAYLVVAFLFYPLGKDRVFYYISLMLPFFVQEIRVKNGVMLWMTAVLYLMIVSDVYLAYQKGVYVYFLG